MELLSTPKPNIRSPSRLSLPTHCTGWEHLELLLFGLNSSLSNRFSLVGAVGTQNQMKFVISRVFELACCRAVWTWIRCDWVELWQAKSSSWLLTPKRQNNSSIHGLVRVLQLVTFAVSTCPLVLYFFFSFKRCQSMSLCWGRGWQKKVKVELPFWSCWRETRPLVFARRGFGLWANPFCRANREF